MGSGLLNVATRALLANQAALQTTGNNISNVNTVGYSRQTVTMQAVQGQNFGGGYIGKGVEITNIERSYNGFLTRQAQLTSSVAAMDTTRASRLLQLEDVFPSGTAGLGSALNDMVNAFSDVAVTPGDLTARSVVLAKADELTTRFRSASTQLDDLSNRARQEVSDSISAVNSLSTRIAALNDQIARAVGSGKSPNDLLDQRDQLIHDVNGYVQTTTVPADDGTLSVFIGSQPLVLGTRVSTLGLANDDYTDLSKLQLTVNNGGLVSVVNENNLNGGSVAGVLKFNNTDLTDARNLLGRMALALNVTVNAQHQLGIDLNGNTGTNMFTAQILPSGLDYAGNTGNAVIGASVADATKMVASDYEVRMGAGGAVDVIRQTDGQVTSFAGMPVTVDGLTFNISSGTAQPGDRFLMKPFSAAAAVMKTAITSASALAVASPVQANAGTSNAGNLTVQGLSATQANANLSAPVTLTFNANGTFNVTGTGTGNPTNVAYTPGQDISYNGWVLTLKGTPSAGDTIAVQPSTGSYNTTNGGNATALLNLRDKAVFDGVTIADGYTSLMSEIGIRSQSAQYAANVSTSIASSAEQSKSSVSGVNLDEEASKLLQYQQAYQASAKMIQISQNIFDSLIQGMG